MYRPDGSGLVPTKRDIRQFNHEIQFGAADLSALPPMGLGRKPLSIKDQGGTNFCTGFGTATASEYIEGIEMSPEYQAALIGEVVGEPILNGASKENAMKALRLFGSLPQKDAPYRLADRSPEFVASLKNWPRDLTQKADDYLKASTYDVMRGSYDAFDNIRSALFQAHTAGEERVAVAFTPFYESWNNPQKNIIRRGVGAFSWHCHDFIDWTTLNGEFVMIEQNSYGTAWGDGGLSYWSREAINQLAENNLTQMEMVRDLTPETAKEAQWGLGVIIYDMLVKADPIGAIKWLVEFIVHWTDNWQPPVSPAPLPPSPPMPVSELPTTKLAEAALSMIGRDASPKNLAPQELSCAEGVSNIIYSCWPDFPNNVLSTADLYTQLKKSPRFKPVLDPVRGCVIVSPTVGDNHGHTGIYIEDDLIASNDSKTGKFETNYTRAGWRKYFITKKGLKGYLFKPV